MWTNITRSTLLIAILMIVGVQEGFGQSANAQITGRITDPSNAVITAADVLITNAGTGISYKSTTDEQGFYRIPFLPPGTYDLTVRAEGFASANRKGVKLDVGQNARLDFALPVGSLVESVEISAAAPLLETENTEVGQVIDNKRIVEMPLNGRNYLQLAQLSPGVLPAVRSSTRGELGIVAMGMRSNQTNILLDGVDNSIRTQGGPAASEVQGVKPSVDAVAEFKVITNNFSAEHGYRMGPKVFITMKSGTNRPHGSLFEFLRNDALDATNFFANRSGAGQPPYRQNQFGGTIGGPIIRNKTFFFASYEGTRIRIGRSYVSTVPSAAAKAGDFSRERDNLSRIYDPLTTTGSGAAATRQPFPNNVIPRNRFDPVSARLVELYPSSNIAGREFEANNYFRAPSDTNNTNQTDLKFDHNFSGADRVSFRYSIRRQNGVELGGMPIETGGPTVGSPARTIEVVGDNLGFNWTRSFTPTMFNEFRFGFTHFPTQFGLLVTEPMNERFGIKGAPGDSFNDGKNQGLSSFTQSHYNSLGTPCCGPQIGNQDIAFLANNLWLQKGSHTIKTGFEFRRSNLYREASRLRRGNFIFTGVYTAQQPNVAASRTATGNSLADLLLGYANRTQVGNTNGENVIHPSWGLYIQDDWKVTPRLTINLGLRWDLLMLGYFPNGTSDGSGGVSNYLTEWVVSPSDPAFNTFQRPTDGRDSGGQNDWNNFAPRLGIAYQLTRKTVLRTGAGMFYAHADNTTVNGSVWTAGPPQFTEITKNGTNLDAAVFVQNGFDPVPFPSTVLQPGVRVDTKPRKWPTSYSAQWYFDLQQELGGGVLFSAGYQGSSSSQLSLFNDVNVPGPHPSIPAVQRRIRPQFNAVWHFWNGGNANYNAMNMRFEKRYSKGFTFLTAYTWSHNIDAQPQRNDEEDRVMANMYNISAERSNSGMDHRHSFTTSTTWELPFGRGQAFGSNWHGVLDAIAGGWQLGGILTLRTGFPFDINFPGDSQNTGTRNRGDRIGSGTVDNPTIDRWFDQFAFVESAPGVFGNAGRYVLFGPGTRNFDFSLAKRFTLPWETHYLQFRFESFNFTNTPKFGQPVATLRRNDTATINSAGEPRRIQFGLKYVF